MDVNLFVNVCPPPFALRHQAFQVETFPQVPGQAKPTQAMPSLNIQKPNFFMTYSPSLHICRFDGEKLITKIYTFLSIYKSQIYVIFGILVGLWLDWLVGWLF
uniref:Uncharacterized protein n=1 Tax=Glossina pallidipes TaxID=7398 RepID=A0A1A9ZNK0_GLOPL